MFKKLKLLSKSRRKKYEGVIKLKLNNSFSKYQLNLFGDSGLVG